MLDPVLIAGFIALFVAVGGVFLAVNLLVGWLVRPRLPNTEKLEVYECGEPTIGSSFVQFDLRFYVVALLFIIFDVEVALFFPWATVFGKATQLADPTVVSVSADGQSLTPEVAGLFKELGLRKPVVPSFKIVRRVSRFDIYSNRGEKPARQAESELLFKKVVKCLREPRLLICLPST